MSDGRGVRSLIPLLVILLVCLLLRLAIVLPGPLPEISKDASQYHAIGENMFRGSYAIVQGVPTLHRLPTYPGFIAAIFALFGPSVRAIVVGQAILDTLACALLFLLARLLFERGPRALGWYGPPAVYAVFVPSILACAVVDSELVFTFFLIATMWMLAHALIRPRGGASAAAGVLYGLADLARGGLAPFSLVVAVLLWRGSKRASWALLFLIGYVAALSPWAIRNVATFGSPVLYSTNSGGALWSGNNPYSGYRYIPKRSPEFRRFLRDNPQFLEFEKEPEDGSIEPYEGRLSLKRDRAYRDLAVKRIRDNPWIFMRNLPRKLFDQYWAPYLAVPRRYSLLEKAALEGFHFLILVGGLLGYLLHRGGPKTVFGLLVIFWTFLHLVTYGSPRFAFPIMFVFILFLGELPVRIDALRRKVLEGQPVSAAG